MLAVAAALVLALAAPASAGDVPVTYDGAPPIQEKKDGAPLPDPAEVAAAAAAPRRLDLGAYSLFAPKPLPVGDGYAAGPRFDTSIDVHGDLPKDPNDAMAEWWRHWNFEYSIYGRGRVVQPNAPPGSVNILPLLSWVRDRVRDHRRNNDEPEP